MSQADKDPILSVKDLEVRTRRGDAIVEDVDLSLYPGEILGLVGESGSGKTTTSLALLGYSTPGSKIAGGTLQIGGKTLKMDESMRGMRGSTVSYVPQDPSQSLNPALRIRSAVGDVMRAHREGKPAEEAIDAALNSVGLDPAMGIADRYPHQLSGGQQQRVGISMALSCEPAVVVLDEPTTGLDVVTQARILDELRRLREEHGISMVYVTHDLAVVSQIADRIAVMYAGRIVEEGPAATGLRRPRHPYTRGLLASIPDHVRPRILEPMSGISAGVGERPQGCTFAPRCEQATEECSAAMPVLQPAGEGSEVRCIHYEQTPPVQSVTLQAATSGSKKEGAPVLEVKGLGAEHRSRMQVTVAASDISFDVHRGECVALVGESGSGKTTIARTIAGLHPLARGEILLHGEPLADRVTKRTRDQRRQVQIVFQNPAAALNPFNTVRQSIGRPAQVLRKLKGRELDAEISRLLECVRLPEVIAGRYPNELSGGERQRVAIARALAADPEIILCDEITSALDVSVQAAILKLMSDLREELGVSLLFITHDLGVVATVADRVMVLDHGSICDEGSTATVLSTPRDDYTKRLLGAAPSISEALREWDAHEAEQQAAAAAPPASPSPSA
jgi:peptide/nickel transport system ATP-binding protein